MIDGEEQLVARAVKGEASAFGQLYDHYQPQIYRFVLVKVSRREEAEDLTHKVFLSALQNIEGYEHRGFPFSSWLYRIARNQIVDHYRVRKSEVGLEEVDKEILSPQGNDPLSLDRKFSLERTLSVIRTLKPEHQDVVLMRFVEDLSIREVAAALGKTEGAIKQIQNRAIAVLKQLLS